MTGEQPIRDTLSFANEQFESSACVRYGFQPAQYTVQQQGEGVGFDTTTQSSNGGTIHWVGTIQGDHIEGTATRTTKEGTVVEGSFLGRMKPSVAQN
jgi:hypothetical protein